MHKIYSVFLFHHITLLRLQSYCCEHSVILRAYTISCFPFGKVKPACKLGVVARDSVMLRLSENTAFLELISWRRLAVMFFIQFHTCWDEVY